jgi:hypothetical protein
MKNTYKNLVVSLLVGAAVFGSIYPATTNAITAADAYKNKLENAASTTPTVEKATPVLTMQVISVKEASQLDLWLEKLAQVESNGRERIKILDVNNKYSYGCLQFQEGTFRNYGVKYGLVAKNANLESVIYDCTLQKQIAKRMIQENHILWQSWYTSVVQKNLGLPPTI